jgi:hypothetical protein
LPIAIRESFGGCDVELIVYVGQVQLSSFTDTTFVRDQPQRKLVHDGRASASVHGYLVRDDNLDYKSKGVRGFPPRTRFDGHKLRLDVAVTAVTLMVGQPVCCRPGFPALAAPQTQVAHQAEG